MMKRNWLCATLMLTCFLWGVRPQAAETARPADDFVDAIGVNTHWAYPNVYTKRFTELKAKLGESGIRHIRDGANEAGYPKIMELYKAYGIRATLICGRRKPGRWPQALDPGRIDEELAGLKSKVLPAVAALEGPNEYDLSRPASQKNAWAEALLAYHKPLYEKIKADPALRGVPVIAPSLTREDAFKKVGDLSPWIDFTCAHPYLSGRNPGTRGWGSNGYGSIDWTLTRLTRVQGPGKPVQFTECGYQNAVQVKSGHEPCSEAAEAKYLPRMFAEYFRRGVIARAFKYELVDSREDPNDIESHFGLLRNDLSEKPSFTAIKNLISILQDRGVPFTPESLDYKLEGDTKTVRCVLLQKRSRDFYLLLWNEVPSWDVKARKEIVNPGAAVTLRLGAPVKAAQACLPNDGTQWRNLSLNAGALALSVPDRLLVVKLTRP